MLPVDEQMKIITSGAAQIVPEADLRKKLKIKDGGDTYIFATTLADSRHVLIITKMAPAQ